MSFFRWLKKVFGGQQASQDMVPYLDVTAGRVVQIPASELRPGAVKVRLQESGEVVWMLPEQLQPGEIKHPEFDEEIRNYIRRIQAAFSEHYSLTIEEWELGFRRDANPAREIAIWSHAADIYQAFTDSDSAAERRQDVYRCVVACMTTGPTDVWKVLHLETLNRTEAQQVIDQFFGKKA